MNSESLFLLILIAFSVLLIRIFNKLIKNRNRVEAAWSDIDVQLTRRYDLIPQLVKVVKQYASYEKSTFEAITTLRDTAQHTIKLTEKGLLETELSAGLMRLIGIAESYPRLQANENFLHLQHELVDVEDHLQSARRYYNGAVREYITAIEIFPNSMLARLLRFDYYEYFEMEESIKINAISTS